MDIKILSSPLLYLYMYPYPPWLLWGRGQGGPNSSPTRLVVVLFVRMERRLDKAIYLGNGLIFGPLWLAVLFKGVSQIIFPILVVMERGTTSKPLNFKFLSMWSLHPDCRKIIEQVWGQSILSCPMFILTHKLKLLKVALKSWNKDSFGNIPDLVDRAKNELSLIKLFLTGFLRGTATPPFIRWLKLGMQLALCLLFK